jgi:hypothetical protein
MELCGSLLLESTKYPLVIEDRHVRGFRTKAKYIDLLTQRMPSPQ